MLICWDLAFPLATRDLILQDASLIIIPSYWHISQAHEDMSTSAVAEINPTSEATFLDSVIVARAFENTAAMVLVNAWGQSQVALPVVGSVPGSKLGIDEVGTRVLDVDMGVPDVAEGVYKLRADMKGEGEGESAGTAFAE